MISATDIGKNLWLGIGWVCDDGFLCESMAYLYGACDEHEATTIIHQIEDSNYWHQDDEGNEINVGPHDKYIQINEDDFSQIMGDLYPEYVFDDGTQYVNVQCDTSDEVCEFIEKNTFVIQIDLTHDWIFMRHYLDKLLIKILVD